MARTVFTRANVLDGDNPARPGMTVVVEGHRIVSVGESTVPAAPDDTVIDLGGRTLMPSLGTGHFHAEFHHIEMSTLDVIFGGAERPAGVLMAVSINTCRNLLESGYTMAVSAACSNDIDACLKMGIAEGLFPGPRLEACSPHLETTGNARPHWWLDSRNTGMQVFVDGPDEFRKAVRTAVSRGSDWIKILPTGGHGITDPHNPRLSHDELLAVVQTAHEMGKRVRAHASWREQIRQCVEAGVDLIDHGDEVDEEIIGMMVERGTYWVPSMRVLDVALGISAGTIPDGGLSADLTKGVRQEWDNLVAMVPIANEAGVKIITGDDYGVPIVPHVPGIYSTELATYVDHVGIKPLDALRWATRNVAHLMNMEGQLGTIAPGALADLIVVRDDPSENVRLLEDPVTNVLAVMKDGQFYKNDLQTA